MAGKMRRVSLLGAFEIQAEVDPPVRDGLILGSRREQMGFVIETSRESIENIVSIVAPPKDGLPRRLTTTIGPFLEGLGCTLVRVELVPLPMDPANKEEGYGAYVQGWLVFRPEERPGNGHRRLSRLPMTATESIQVAVGGGLPIMAASELLQLNVGQFLDEIDGFSRRHARESKKFSSFIDTVTATDFARFYEAIKDGGAETDGGEADDEGPNDYYEDDTT